MKLKIILLSLITLCQLSSKSQIMHYAYNAKDFNNFLNSKTMIVLTGNTIYDNQLQASVTKYWKMTPIAGTITVKELKGDIIKDPATSFLYTYSDTVLAEYFLKEIESELSLALGDKIQNKFFNIFYNSICNTPLSVYSGENNIENCVPRLDYMIKGLNDAVELIKTKKLSNDKYASLPGAINLKAKKIAEKTLLINADAKNWKGFDVYKTSDFTENYPYKYKFVSEAEYLKALEGNASDVCILFTALEKKFQFMVYDPSTKETIYYKLSKGTAQKDDNMAKEFRFKKVEIKDLLKAIKGD